MPRAPRITSADLLRALHRAGWTTSRQSGSHMILVHPERAGARVGSRSTPAGFSSRRRSRQSSSPQGSLAMSFWVCCNERDGHLHDPA
ncbi:MAG: type II toxin-antitoxin system HicA family toxin [Pseudonocardiaceae bacterium]